MSKKDVSFTELVDKIFGEGIGIGDGLCDVSRGLVEKLVVRSEMRNFSLRLRWGKESVTDGYLVKTLRPPKSRSLVILLYRYGHAEPVRILYNGKIYEEETRNGKIVTLPFEAVGYCPDLDILGLYEVDSGITNILNSVKEQVGPDKTLFLKKYESI